MLVAAFAIAVASFFLACAALTVALRRPRPSRPTTRTRPRERLRPGDVTAHDADTSRRIEAFHGGASGVVIAEQVDGLGVGEQAAVDRLRATDPGEADRLEAVLRGRR